MTQRNKPKLSFIGLGYVGLTTAACFASKGFITLCYDIDQNKMEKISKGEAPFYEPGLEELLKTTISNKTLQLANNSHDAVMNSDITFITVGTPSKPDGDIDLTYVQKAAQDIGQALRKKKEWHLVVVKSTVTPTTTEELIKPILERESGKKCGEDFGLCMNPEFLREGNAVEDTLNPDRIIIGECDPKSGEELEKIYREFYGSNTPPILRTSPVNAELIKYANNAFLAMKVSFINMIANLCQKLPGADVEHVAAGIGLDKRIGPYFLKAGPGWGGSCWPKDLQALRLFFQKAGVEAPLINATLEVNEEQPQKIVMLAEEILGSLRGKRVAILGLAFKSGTDDIRGAVSLKIIKELKNRGAAMKVYDPKAMQNVRKELGDNVEYASSSKECLAEAELAIILTDWPEFNNLRPEDFRNLMNKAQVLDARRIYNISKFLSEGVRISAIGLGY